ncbi:hypothetical protein ACMAUO_19450 [Gluconacetobacter sp. Hr-1-5]|uniref:hypothetical protein n=1 Tax=Gluconacetobacter sp. Hr-1-5 TaxID=3395370 RepID=UPI003B527C92
MPESIDQVVWRANFGEPGTLGRETQQEDLVMPILLWLLGIPIPIIILLLLFYH